MSGELGQPERKEILEGLHSSETEVVWLEDSREKDRRWGEIQPVPLREYCSAAESDAALTLQPCSRCFLNTIVSTHPNKMGHEVRCRKLAQRSDVESGAPRSIPPHI